jgi:hypothetical protein
VKEEQKNYYSMTEFFGMKKYRRSGVGKISALRLFNRFKGEWEVSQMKRLFRIYLCFRKNPKSPIFPLHTKFFSLVKQGFFRSLLHYLSELLSNSNKVYEKSQLKAQNFWRETISEFTNGEWTELKSGGLSIQTFTLR